MSNRAYAGRPSMCRNCGALVGAGETTCTMCGAAATAAAPSAAQTKGRRPAYDRETMRFARAILQRPATFTFIFLIANVFVFLLTYFEAGGTQNTPAFNATLVAYGAKMNALIDQGQWWRFVTPIFLHGSGVHLLMNMYGLWILGPYVERLYGSAKFVVFWVLTGMAGVAASYMTVQPNMQGGALARFFLKAQDGVSVGASGALFGLIGVLFVFGIKFRHELPEGFKRAFGTGMLPTILLNIFIGYVFPFIDNAAHMGGLAAGAALALVVGYKRPGERASIAFSWHAAQVAAIALVVVSFLLVARHFPENIPKGDAALPSSVTGNTADIGTYLKAMSEGERAFVLSFNTGAGGSVGTALNLLDRAPYLEEPAYLLRNELKSLLLRARGLSEADPNDPELRSVQRVEKEKLKLAHQAWSERYKLWLELEGPRYGLVKQIPQNPSQVR